MSISRLLADLRYLAYFITEPFRLDAMDVMAKRGKPRPRRQLTLKACNMCRRKRAKVCSQLPLGLLEADLLLSSATGKCPARDAYNMMWNVAMTKDGGSQKIACGMKTSAFEVNYRGAILY